MAPPDPGPGSTPGDHIAQVGGSRRLLLCSSASVEHASVFPLVAALLDNPIRDPHIISENQPAVPPVETREKFLVVP